MGKCYKYGAWKQEAYQVLSGLPYMVSEMHFVERVTDFCRLGALRENMGLSTGLEKNVLSF